MYVHSMDSFLPNELNNTIKTKDIQKIKYYGPYAAALGFIINNGNRKVSDLSKQFTVYRGMQVSQDELNNKYKVGDQVALPGFMSTSSEWNAGLNTSLKKSKKMSDASKIPVMLEIDFKGNN